MEFLASLGGEIKTATRQTRDGWEAKAQLIHPTDSPKPVYLGKGSTEEEALAKAIDALRDFWEWRVSPVARNYPQR